MKRFAIIAVGSLLLARPALAHHSAAAFDPSLPVTVTGTVAKVEWTSPHARIYVTATDAEGAAQTWDFELPSPVTLMRRGWSRNSLAVGAAVTVTGIRAREHPNIAIAKGVLDAGGKRLFSGVADAAE
jgi:uncharacterized protein DUF6152